MRGIQRSFDLDQWRIKRLNEGISNATLNRDIGTLKSPMTKATEWEVIKESPLKSLKLFKIDSAQRASGEPGMIY